jgi:hypothetical protein
MTETMCLGCARELTRREVREIVDTRGRPHGPFCADCARRAEGNPYDQWLDEEWRRQNPH